MFGFLKLLASPVTEIVDGILENRKTKRKLKQAVLMKKLEMIEKGDASIAEWEKVALENSGWKDEYLTIVLSLPMILVFVPSMAPYIRDGFEVLQGLPDWYKAAVGVMIAASFGIKSFTKFFGK